MCCQNRLWSAARRLGLVAGTLAVYSLAFLPLAAVVGPDARALLPVPALYLAWHLGARAGVAAYLALAVWQFAALDPAAGLAGPAGTGWVGEVVTACLTAAAGRLGAGYRRLQPALGEGDAALLEGLERLQVVARVASDAVWDLKLETGDIWWGDGFQSLFGYTAAEAGAGLAFWETCVHPDDRARVLADLRAAIDAGRPWAAEYRFRRKDGTYADILDRGEVLRAGPGRAGRMVGAMQDLTARKQAEEQARRREQRLALQQHTLLDLERDVLGGGDPEAAVRRITAATARGLGITRVSLWRHTADRQGIRCVDLYEADLDRHSGGLELSADTHPGYFRALEASDVIPAGDAHADPRTREFTHDYLAPLGIGAMLDVPLRPFGRLEGVLCREHVGPARAWEADEQVFAMAVGTLVSLAQERWERERAEEALRRERAFLKAVQDNVADGIVACDADGNATLVNWYGELFRGVPGQPPAPKDWGKFYEAYQPDRQTRIPLAELPLLRALRGERVRDVEIALRSPQGEWRDYVVNGQPLAGPDGRPDGAVIALHDVTARKRLEGQFLQAQKMEAVGRLAGGVAHDFNNLLTIINGYAELLLGQSSPGDSCRGPIQEIQAAGGRAADLTRQLLAFSRRQVVAPRVIDLNELVRGAEKMLRRLIGEDVTMVTALHPGPAHVRADPGQLEQVLLNLAVNARDAMPRGGRLTVTTRKTDDGPAGTRKGSRVVLEVADTGEGMTAEVKARVFEPFFTTKPVGQGTGLGLAAAFGIVQEAGGEIEVDSAPGAGASFRVSLPGVAPPAEPAASPASAGGVSRGTETVLVVEDEEGVRALVWRVLEDAGYTVLTAGNAREGLAAADRHPGPLHLLVTDVVMPGGGATELARTLAGRRPGLRCLYLSGYNEDDIIRHGVRRQDVNFLQKPFAPAALARAVRAALDATPRTRAAVAVPSP